MKTYTWLGPENRAVGDIIIPGNWGRIVLSNPNHDWLQMEKIFELVRQSINPALPSRLHSAFVFEDDETASLLHSKRPTDVFYSVVLLEPKANLYRADMSLIHPLVLDPLTYERARLYWDSARSNIKWPEVLTLSRLKIISKL